MAEYVWFITGASSGFGKAIGHEALRRGHKVIATARSASALGELKAAGAATMDLDVTANDKVLAAKFSDANAIYGKITHVANAAGYALTGAVEEASYVFSPTLYIYMYNTSLSSSYPSMALTVVQRGGGVPANQHQRTRDLQHLSRGHPLPSHRRGRAGPTSRPHYLRQHGQLVVRSLPDALLRDQMGRERDDRGPARRTQAVRDRRLRD